MARIFCTDLAIERGEPQEGTGSAANRYFFIKWPRGKWRRPRAETADLGPDMPATITRWLGDGRHIGFVDGAFGENMQVFAFPEGLTRTIKDVDELRQVLDAWGGGDSIDGTPIGPEVILCCTDAKTDACCARYGFSVFKTLAATADPSRFAVFQCTHIGGCHLAPSIMVMSSKDRYGRLQPEQVGDFLAKLSAGERYLPCFKGSAALSAAAQVAEIAAMRWAEANGFHQPDVVFSQSTSPSEEDPTEITVRVADVSLTLMLESQHFEVHGHCEAIDEGPGEMEQRWVCTRILERGSEGLRTKLPPGDVGAEF